MVLIIVLILGFVFWRLTNDDKVNYIWHKTYSDGEVQPYDFGVFKGLLEKSSSQKFNVVKQDLLSSIGNSKPEHSTYIYIGDIAYLGKDEIENLIGFAEKGGKVWISAEWVPDTLLAILGGSETSLQIEQFNRTSVKVKTHHPIDSSFEFKWTSRSFNKKPGSFEWCFITGGKENTQVIPRGSINEALNYIELNRGKGKLYLHTSPILFSNYVLNKESGFVYLNTVFRGIELEHVYYDISARNPKEENEDKHINRASPLAYILSQKSLRWAWYILLIMAVLFFAFYTKRKQRVMPVLAVKSNFGLRFIETLSALHLKQENYKGMSELKMNLFLQFLKQKLRINLADIEQEQYDRISIKSGVSIQQIQLLFERYKQIQNSDEVSAEMFIELNRLINGFKKLQEIK
jgi:hypothetical protein